MLLKLVQAVNRSQVVQQLTSTGKATFVPNALAVIVRVNMFSLEIPLINSSFKSNCPVCGETIGGHLIKNKFACPFCNKSLGSNKKESGLKAVIVGIILYIFLTIVINLVPVSGAALVVSIVILVFLPMLASYIYIKATFKVTKLSNEL